MSLIFKYFLIATLATLSYHSIAQDKDNRCFKALKNISNQKGSQQDIYLGKSYSEFLGLADVDRAKLAEFFHAQEELGNFSFFGKKKLVKQFNDNYQTNLKFKEIKQVREKLELLNQAHDSLELLNQAQSIKILGRGKDGLIFRVYVGESHSKLVKFLPNFKPSQVEDMSKDLNTLAKHFNSPEGFYFGKNSIDESGQAIIFEEDIFGRSFDELAEAGDKDGLFEQNVERFNNDLNELIAANNAFLIHQNNALGAQTYVIKFPNEDRTITLSIIKMNSLYDAVNNRVAIIDLD